MCLNINLANVLKELYDFYLLLKSVRNALQLNICSLDSCLEF